MTGVFETIRVRRGSMPLIDRHMRRFSENSRTALKTDLPPDTLNRVIDVAASGPAENVVRVVWDGRDLTFSTRDVPETGALRLIVSAVVHPGYTVKTTDRGAFDEARREAAAAGADEAILLTAEGYVAEGTIFAPGWFAEDSLCLPALGLNILPSIGRQRVVEVAGDLGVDVHEGRFSVENIIGRPAFVVTSVRGVVPVAGIGGQSAPPDDRIDALRDTFWR